MSWHAPALDHLVDKRLQTARLELLEDGRLQKALHNRGRESAPFLLHLIEEKLAAAARSGVGAVEASLRASATACLVDVGYESSQARSALDDLGTELLNPEERFPHELRRDSLRPGVLAALFFVAWTVTITLGWILGDAGNWLYALFAAGGTLATALVYMIARLDSLRHRSEIAREYPAHICRHYMQSLEEGLARYEVAVKALAGAKSDGKS
jgi:hypothetical protein